MIHRSVIVLLGACDLIVVSAMICFAGCATPAASKADGTRKLTATGAIIAKQDAVYFYYKEQCLACGSVSEKQVGSAYPKGAGTIRADFTCPQCGKKQDVRININEMNPAERSAAHLKRRQASPAINLEKYAD